MGAGLTESRVDAARYGEWKKLRDAENQWFKVAEAAYDNFLYYAK